MFATLKAVILSFASNFLADVKFHIKQGEVINKTKQNGLGCPGTAALKLLIIKNSNNLRI